MILFPFPSGGRRLATRETISVAGNIERLRNVALQAETRKNLREESSAILPAVRGNCAKMRE